MDWYASFLFCVFLLWIASAPRDRNALRIILIASLVSEVLVELVTKQIIAPWKLAIPGAIETLTIMAMLQWARNRTGYMQAALLCIAWLAHAGCYLDLLLKTDMTYSRYEAIIQLVAVAQILACYETLARCGGAVASWVASLRAGGGRGLSVAGMRHSVLHGEAAEIVSPSCRAKENIRG